MQHSCEHCNGDESHRGMIPRQQAKEFACHNLTLREAALLARERTDALHRVQRAESKLARLGKRLTLAALAATEPLPLADPAPAAVRTGDRLDLAMVISRIKFEITIVIAICVTIMLIAYSCFAEHSAGVGNLPLPAGFLALVFLLVVLPAQTCAVHSTKRNRIRTARTTARYEKDSRKRALVPLAVRGEHHRAWLALEAEINRLLVAYHRGVAGAETRILHRRARHGQANPFPAPPADTVAVSPSSVRAVVPTMWLDAPAPPEVQVVLEPSLRLLERYQPTAAPQPASPRDSS